MWVDVDSICFINCRKLQAVVFRVKICDMTCLHISLCSAEPNIEKCKFLTYASPSFAQWVSAASYRLGFKALTVESNKLKDLSRWVWLNDAFLCTSWTSRGNCLGHKYAIFIDLCWLVVVSAADLGELFHVKQESVNRLISELCISWWPLSHPIIGSNPLETAKQTCKPSLVQAFQRRLGK